MTTSWRHRLEAALLATVWRGLGALSLARASAIGGCLAGWIGPLTRAHRRAEAAMRRALPALDEVARARALAAMWDNLGRTAAEYAHLQRIDTKDPRQVEIVGGPIIEALRDDNRNGIFLGAHCGNWEIGPLAVVQRGVALTALHRAANNPLAEKLILAARGEVGAVSINKGAEGARAMFKALKAGRHLGLLGDQKLNEGIAVPFFGRPAMTAPAWARFALRERCPVALGLVERLEGPRFRLHMSRLELPETGDAADDERMLLASYHARLEDFIRAHPGQWFWVHRRWLD
ncbi:MAG: lauroyl acyltransferase [Alphaproteobacteria bacterium]|nr:lauroyl acyltransferase [Alphaproteobacteria bacterium]